MYHTSYSSELRRLLVSMLTLAKQYVAKHATATALENQDEVYKT